MKGRTERHGTGWRYIVDIGDDPATGKRRRKTRGGFTREKDAQTALNTVLVQLGEGRYAEPTATTLKSFILDEWLPSRESQVRASTALSYCQVLEGHVLPRIGALELRKLRPRHISELYADLLANGGRDKRRGKTLSARTVRYTGMVLTRALDDAVRLGYLATNPAKLVERPKARDVEMRVWSASEARLFLAHVRHDRLYGLWVLYLTTGLRRGEALGLRWGDVDLDAGKLAVRRTLIAVAGKPAWSEPKTERSRRVVALDPGTVAVLRAHRLAQLEERIAIGPGYHDDGLIFCTVAGGVLHPDNVTRAFDRHVKASALPRIRLHDMRHSAATMLLEEGVALKIVSERLGHSSIAITGDLYQHVTEHMQTDAAAKAGRALLGR